MENYNKFDPKTYTEDLTIQLTLSEVEKFESFELKRAKADIEKCAFSDMKKTQHYEQITKRIKQEAQNMRELDGFIFADVDYYMERYRLLKKFKKVEFALNGAFHHAHNTNEIAKALLTFIEDPKCIKLLKQHLKGA